MNIEHNVPIPGKRTKYPFEDLEVGDSFFIEGRTTKGIASSIVMARRRNPDRKYTSRTVDGGVRVWRVA